MASLPARRGEEDFVYRLRVLRTGEGNGSVRVMLPSPKGFLLLLFERNSQFAATRDFVGGAPGWLFLFLNRGNVSKPRLWKEIYLRAQESHQNNRNPADYLGKLGVLLLPLQLLPQIPEEITKSSCTTHTTLKFQNKTPVLIALLLAGNFLFFFKKKKNLQGQYLLTVIRGRSPSAFRALCPGLGLYVHTTTSSTQVLFHPLTTTIRTK